MLNSVLSATRREAAAQPSIFFAANNPYASTSSSSNAAAAIALGLANTSLAAQLASLGMPSEEWRGVFLQKFRTLRQHYSEPPTKKVPFIQDKMPKRNDERGWYIWIHGKVPPEEEEKLLAIERAQKLAKQEAAEAREDSDMDMEESGDETPASSKAVPREWKIKEPSGGSLRRLSTEQALDLLNQFPNWLSHKTNIPTPDASPAAVLQPLHARWLFALLAWLDDRLLSEQISVLRTVARACIAAISMCRMRRKALQSRKKKSTTEADAEAVEAQLAQEQPAELESSLPEADESGAWMVVTIVAGIWGQSDLWDDAMTDMKRIA